MYKGAEARTDLTSSQRPERPVPPGRERARGGEVGGEVGEAAGD